jgi:hypothetical protein
MTVPLELTRTQVLAYRRRVQALDERLAAGAASLQRAAWAGLQDSMPRAAVLSLHARGEGVEPKSWEDPALVQLWGPRFSAYVVAEPDIAVFSLGRLSDDPKLRRLGEDLANRLDAFLAGRTMTYGEAGRALGVHPNRLRYAAPTGRVLIRWEGARQPTIWTVPAPEVDPAEARRELARRYLHFFGVGTPGSFAEWAGVKPAAARATFDDLAESVLPVRTPVGDASMLMRDEPTMRAPASAPAPARLLPSGDTYYLLQGTERDLLVPDPARQSQLWTARVWPGAVVVGGEVVGTWRRAAANVTITTWRPLKSTEAEAVEAEAESLPLPGLQGQLRVVWEDQ